MCVYVYCVIHARAKLKHRNLFIRFAAVYIGFEEKFWIQNRSTSQGLPYDFSSVMHFRHRAFSRSRCKSTVVPHNRTVPITILGRSATGSGLDFLHLTLLYCGGTDVKSRDYVNMVV